jgi:hypothetical protein
MSDSTTIGSAAARQARARAIDCFRRITDRIPASRCPADAALNSREMDELRRCITDYIVVVHSLDTPPERALSEVKEMTSEALRQFDRAYHQTSDAMIGWMIEAYYRAA